MEEISTEEFAGMANDSVGRRIMREAMAKADQKKVRAQDEAIIDKVLMEYENEEYYKKMGL